MSSSMIGAAGTPLRFDPATITAALDRAIAAVPPDKRGTLWASVDLDRATGGVVVRIGPARVEAHVGKARGGKLEAGASGSVSFAAELPPDELVVACADWREVRALFRAAGYGYTSSIVAGVSLGLVGRVPFLPAAIAGEEER